MRKIFFSMIVCGLAVSAGPAQNSRVPVKSPVPAAAAQNAAQISEADWKILADALGAENWNRAAALAAGHLQSLKNDNEKKQLAQLRYIYLYALAGKILAFNAQKNAAEAQKTWTELDRVIETFVGREFLLPPRPFAADCEKRLNYICQVKDNPKALRTTATNKAADSILSFDYVVFDQPADTAGFAGKEAFLGGRLLKAEYNEDPSKPWAIRLFFNEGFVGVVAK
jgi:hypothetical protein